MAMQTIEELFEHELKDIYSAEHMLLDALEQMAGESSDREIKKAFMQHRKETQGQIKRLEKIFKSLGQKPEAETCPGIEGLIKEKKTFMRRSRRMSCSSSTTSAPAQKIERYEITAYESLIDMADKLGMARCRRAARAEPAGRRGGAQQAEDDRVGVRRRRKKAKRKRTHDHRLAGGRRSKMAGQESSAMAKKKSAASDTDISAGGAGGRANGAAPRARPKGQNGDARHDPTHDEIAEAAYHRYLSRRGAGGSDFDDWVEAERDLRSRSASTPKSQ